MLSLVPHPINPTRSLLSISRPPPLSTPSLLLSLSFIGQPGDRLLLSLVTDTQPRVPGASREPTNADSTRGTHTRTPHRSANGQDGPVTAGSSSARLHSFLKLISSTDVKPLRFLPHQGHSVSPFQKVMVLFSTALTDVR
ncbi:unnamed protein product [Arctogadus glacialis]